jgi:uncharacterized beta barrel domain-containing protein DUF5777
MTATARMIGILLLAGAGIHGSVPLGAQEAQEPAPPPRPPEGSVIINLPSAEVPKPGTLQFLVTHRFSQPIAGSDIHTLFSFDSPPDLGLGISYAPLRNLELGFGRSSLREVYELTAKYHVLSAGALSLGVRLGEDWRTASGQQNRNGFFAQTIVALSLGSRVRITAVPTYVSTTAGLRAYFVGRQPDGSAEFFIEPQPSYRDVFNWPIALSVAVTGSVNIHGEVVPSYRRTVVTIPFGDATHSTVSKNSPGVGWIASIEKTVLRHRFAFTIGNQRETTVDQYVASNFLGRPHDYFFGFNLVRLWSLK